MSVGQASAGAAGQHGAAEGAPGATGGIAAIKADLARRVAAIEWRAGPARLAGEVDQIRKLARRHQMLPAVAVAQHLERALARGEHGAMVHAWLAILNEAVLSDRQDAAASDTFAAACQVRFAA